MEVFNYVLILLAAVLLSNLINRFIPLLSVPLIQIAIGVLIDVIPYGALGFEFDLEPELFFVLFLSPLVFHSARTADLKTMRRMITPIIAAAIGLVLVSVFAVGYFTNMLIPSIPLVAAFALAAALGPTDIVAVEAVAHRVAMPRRIESILSGESIVNDATGIVCFQFIIAAAVDGSFNIAYGLWRFLFVALGGLLVGIVLTVAKFLFIRWLRSVNITSAPLFIALGIITPFIIFMLAESIGTSGILAVFASGIGHALYRDKFNPEIIILNNATENVWSVLSFNLDGLVFVILGTQLPRILRLEIGWASGLGGRQIVLYVFLIYVAMSVTRFLWWFFTVRSKVYSDPEEPIGAIRAGLIFSVAGARGAVSMASALSIPLFLMDDVAFPERELIILLVCGIITVSMLMTNFVLPLFVTKNADESKEAHDNEQKTRAEILQTVIGRLREQVTPENHAATEIIIHHYFTRMNKYLVSRQVDGRRRRFRNGFLLLEKNLYLTMAETGQISEKTADHFLEETERLYDESKQRIGAIRTFFWLVGHLYTTITWKGSRQKEVDDNKLREVNARQMRRKQRELHLKKGDPALDIIIKEHEKVVSARMGLSANMSENLAGEVLEVAENALYMERVLVQQMMEDGRLSKRAAKVMQANIIMLEAQLHAE